MPSIAGRADFFDASALIRLYVPEPGADAVRQYFNARATKYTTAFCFYEALNILKTKWLHHKKLSREEYLRASFQLTAWYGASAERINDLDFTDPITFSQAKSLVERFDVDLSDAFQILSVKLGYFSPLINESRTVLVTADKSLAYAACQEGLRVWSVLEEPPPD